jgi:hypothetical protein
MTTILDRIYKSTKLTNLTDIVDLFNLIYLGRKDILNSIDIIIDKYNNERDFRALDEEPNVIKQRLLYKILRVFYKVKGLEVHSTDYGNETPEMNAEDTKSAVNYLFTTLCGKWEEFSKTNNHREACSLIFPMNNN